MRYLSIASLTAATCALLGGTARADLRSFTHTYEYQTMPEGKSAFEFWHTQTRATDESSTPLLYQGILEIEHGITEHWDLAFYQVFEQTTAGSIEGAPTTGEGFHLSEAKIETRYRLAERGEWPIDTLLYLELAKEFDESLYEIEGKVIGARDFGDITVAANAIVEIALGKDAVETEPEIGWAVGATYPVHPKIRLGVETWGAVEEEEVYASAGPAINLSPASNIWTTITFGFGLSNRAREEGDGVEHGFFSARAIIGVEL